jgi:hypothetical protein
MAGSQQPVAPMQKLLATGYKLPAALAEKI